jgi:hypothetical protein
MHKLIFGSSFSPGKLARRSGTVIDKGTASIINSTMMLDKHLDDIVD